VIVTDHQHFVVGQLADFSLADKIVVALMLNVRFAKFVAVEFAFLPSFSSNKHGSRSPT